MEAPSLPILNFQMLHVARFLLVFIASISWLASNSGGDACDPFICGNHTFDHPFSHDNSVCGDPALHLDCDNDRPLLNISGYEYYILQPQSYQTGDPNRQITIISKSLLQDICTPSPPFPFWPGIQFHFVEGYTPITLWEKCVHKIINDSKKAFKLECSDDWYFVQNLSFPLYFHNSSFQSFVHNSSFHFPDCKSAAGLLVRDSDIPGLPQNLNQILHKGFDITWNVNPSCEECELRSQICIFNVTSKQFMQCQSSSSGSSKFVLKLGCSIGAAAVALVLIFIVYVKRRKSPSPIFEYFQRKDMETGLAGTRIGNLSIFGYDELEQATNFFHEKNQLGDGGFGSVFLGKLKYGRTVAVKRLYQENSRRVEQFMNEIQILSSLAHPNLLRLYGCSDPQSPVLLLVYEFVPNGTLAEHLHGSRRGSKGLAWEIRLNIAIETAQALAFLHSVDPPIFHRDVKSSNILLDDIFRAKVADFGLSRLMPPNASHVTTAPQGTPGYVDPEYHQCFQLTDKSDVYSFGVVLVEIISAKVAVDVNRNINEISLANMALDKIRRGALNELVDPDLKTETNREVKAMVAAVAELAYQCLASKSSIRPDMKEVASRLEDIKLYASSASEQQSSLRKESTEVGSVVLPVSPSSAHEEWASVASSWASVASNYSA